jgi:IS5 family transposase
LRNLPVKLVRAWEFGRNLPRLVLANVRIPEMVEGDLHAQLNADRTGLTRLAARSREQGAERIRANALRAQGMTNKKGTRNCPLSAETKARNRTKLKLRAKVEHPFLVTKRISDFDKGRYRGLT